MNADRTPEQIIGHDRLMQLVFEGYAVVRADHIAEKEARTAYKPQVIDYADSGVSELVLTDEPHVYAEAATVFVIRDMETRRISGFQWFTKNIPNPQLPPPPRREALTMGERGEDVLNRRYPDDYVVRFGNFFFQADVAHVALLHSKALKGGFTVNGRRSFNPWSLARPTEEPQR